MGRGPRFALELRGLVRWVQMAGLLLRMIAGDGKTPTRALRKAGYSQMKMQTLTGTCQSDDSKIETGKRNMTLEQCRRIALALETGMDRLAGLTDAPRPYPPKKIRTAAVQRSFFHAQSRARGRFQRK